MKQKIRTSNKLRQTRLVEHCSGVPDFVREGVSGEEVKDKLSQI
jgi:hypothetical protein